MPNGGLSSLGSFLWCTLRAPAAGVALLSLATAAGAVTADDYSGCGGFSPSRVLNADPSNYESVLDAVEPGDLVSLAAGTYTSGLVLWDVAGKPEACIVIEGPSAGPPAVFTGNPCCNTVSLSNASYLVIRNLELDGQDFFVDAVKAEPTGGFVHHLTLENLYIHGYGVDQQAVGINTKCPVWNLVVRGNVIEQAGTGAYFGDSNGGDDLANSLIEYNLIQDSVGYDLQIKHQTIRPCIAKRRQKLLARSIGIRVKIDRAQEALQRLAHRMVVIDDSNAVPIPHICPLRMLGGAQRGWIDFTRMTPHS